MGRPKWKSREAYEETGGEPREVPFGMKNVPCPACGARKGRPCVGPAGNVRQHGPHPERRKAARKAHRNWEARNRRVALAQRRRWETVTVRFQCPVCGGGHGRSDHDGADTETCPQ